MKTPGRCSAPAAGTARPWPAGPGGWETHTTNGGASGSGPPASLRDKTTQPLTHFKFTYKFFNKFNNHKGYDHQNTVNTKNSRIPFVTQPTECVPHRPAAHRHSSKQHINKLFNLEILQLLFLFKCVFPFDFSLEILVLI